MPLGLASAFVFASTPYQYGYGLGMLILQNYPCKKGGKIAKGKGREARKSVERSGPGTFHIQSLHLILIFLYEVGIHIPIK